MTEAALAPAPEAPLLADLPTLATAAAEAAAALVAAARGRLAGRVVTAGRLSAPVLEADQFAAHGLAWMATYAEAPAGELCALFGSTDHLEIAVNAGDAAALLKLSRGAPVIVHLGR